MSSVLCSLVLAAVLRADTAVFVDGKALLPVYVGARATVEERAAADELARVLGVMSGLAWPVRPEPAGGAAGFYVGRTRAAEQVLAPLRPAVDVLAPRPGEIGPDGFRLRSAGGRIFIEGATPEATAFAVSWLLQREGGVRWYAPGPLGEVIPRRAAWALPELAVVREPAYVSREISGADEAWARRNGLRQRLEYSHNLANLFTPETYDAHPEWFGVVRGVRRRPAGGGEYHWQPDLSRADVAEFAAARAAEALAGSPGRASFSLGMNDTVRFDQGAGTRAVVEPLRYFRGMPDYAPLLFGFMNRAAESLGRARPEPVGKYLGCLAYFWAENPPPFPVHPRVVPYVTTDRSQFYDAAYRAADLELMARWGRSGVRAFGLWEYGYGSAFVVPRTPHGVFAEAVREGWRCGARGYMADTGPHAGFDAYKVWLLAQLLWEPERDPAQLEADFFNGWYGPAAGPMRRFFAGCEAQWLAQAGPPWWIKFYQQQDQPLLFPPEVCRALRASLDEAAAACGSRSASGDVAARVALTSRAFAVTEAAVAFDAQRRALADPAAEALPPAALGAQLLAWQRARAALERALAEATAGPAPALATANAAFLLRNDPAPRLLAALGRRERAAPLTALGELLLADTAVPAHWGALAAACADGRLRRAVDIAANGSFAAAAPEGHQPRFLHPLSGDLPADWAVRTAPTERGRVALGSAVAGVRVLRIEGAWDTQVNQALPVEAGRLYVAEVQMRGRSSPGNDAGLTLAFLDEGGRLVGEYRATMLPKGESAWRTLTLADVAPAAARQVVVGLVATRQFGGDWLEATGVAVRESQRTED